MAKRRRPVARSTPSRRRYRDDRPYGTRPDVLEPNNYPSSDLGHGTRQDNSLAWLLLIGIIMLVLLLA